MTTIAGNRTMLLEAIRMLPAFAEADGLREPEPAVIELAARFVGALPEERATPRVACDEDGDVLLNWPRALAVTVSAGALHATERPGSSSRHMPPVAYEGGPIPIEILALVPEDRAAAEP